MDTTVLLMRNFASQRTEIVFIIDECTITHRLFLSRVARPRPCPAVVRYGLQINNSVRVQRKRREKFGTKNSARFDISKRDLISNFDVAAPRSRDKTRLIASPMVGQLTVN